MAADSGIAAGLGSGSVSGSAMQSDGGLRPSGVRQMRDTPEDADALRALLDAGLHAGELPDMTFALVQAAIDQAVTTTQPALLAFEEAVAVGFFLSEYTMLWVAPHARRRGHGRALVTTALAALTPAAAEALELCPPVGNAVAEAFARSLGFSYITSSLRLRLPADVVLPAPQWLESYSQRSFRPGADDAAYIDCVTTAFREHHPPLALTAEQLARAQARPDFSPDNIGVVVPDGEPQTIVAFCRVELTPEEGAEVRSIGVLHACRGLGLGRELLRWGVERLREQGAGDVLLNVEGRNTNALTLYLRHGFEHHAEWPHWSLIAAVDS